VNACPEAAIEIEIVNMSAWRENYSGAESPGTESVPETIFADDVDTSAAAA
jgi:hypothetical protein